jgi:signal peptidase I
MAMKEASRGRNRSQSGRRSQSDRARLLATQPRKARNVRESIESFVVVFVTLLIWSLEAEGFVIPTGSMAPTLLGRHKEVVCPQCGYVFTVNADREVDTSASGSAASRRIETGTCENCRFDCKVGDAPSFSGDRIYVAKNGLSLPFLGMNGRVNLKRWDVTVFWLPEEPEVRYIKRLVGMPEEVIRIAGGDLWARRKDGPGEFQRLRRPLAHQQAMQMMVYDDARRAAALRDDPQWRRWVATSADAWIESEPGRYECRGPAAKWHELRYHHVVPTPEQCRAILTGGPLPRAPRASLITDYLSYNTDVSAEDHTHPRRAARPWFQPNWVGDLTLSLRLTVREPTGQVRLELIKSGQSNRCDIDLATGELRLFHATNLLDRRVLSALARPGTHELSFANVDDRLTVWIDGTLPFCDGRNYGSQDDQAAPTEADLEPARISARGAAVEFSNLVLKRDLYYTLEPTEADYANLDENCRGDSGALLDLLSDPERFSALTHNPPREFALRPGHYLMLGDNSPWSRDARAWGRTDQIDPDLPSYGWDKSGRASWEVPETLLVGKAFCVYWPHPKPVWPRIRLGADLQLPILPYIERMRWIR